MAGLPLGPHICPGLLVPLPAVQHLLQHVVGVRTFFRAAPCFENGYRAPHLALRWVCSKPDVELSLHDIRSMTIALDNSSWANYIADMGKTPPRDIIGHIAKIREAANLLIEKELNARGMSGIVPAHGLVFAFLFRQNGPVPIKSLVQQSGRVKSTVTGMVNTLERHGYVFKQECAEDARSTRIGLTEKGWAVKRDFEEISEILEARVYGNMPTEDRQRLMELLSVIEGNMRP